MVLSIRGTNMKQHLSSLLAIVNFYRTLAKKGIIEKGSSGYNRMQQLEDRLENKKHPPRGRRVTL